jgi:hypothetical protein
LVELFEPCDDARSCKRHRYDRCMEGYIEPSDVLI